MWKNAKSRTRRTAPQADGSRYNDAAPREAASVRILSEEASMSWYMCMDIYTKKKGCDWQNKVNSVEYSCLKNLCGSRGCLDETIPVAKLSDEDHEILKKMTREYDYHSYDYFGSVTKETFATFDFPTTFITDEEHGNKPGYLVSKENAEKISCISPEEYLNTPTEELDQKYIKIYTESFTERGYERGEFYTVDCFYNLLETILKNYKKVIEKQHDWEKLQNSLDYLKLSEEEKENVSSQFEYLEEEIEYVKNNLVAINQVIGALQLFEDYDTQVVAFIYSD